MPNRDLHSIIYKIIPKKTKINKLKGIITSLKYGEEHSKSKVIPEKEINPILLQKNFDYSNITPG